MSTNSGIIVKINDSCYLSVYCHWDGYPEWMLSKLVNYKTLSSAIDLVRHGYMSVLDAENDCPPGHTFETPVAGKCIYYGRDRGEDGVDMEISFTLEQAKRKAGSNQYNYLFSGNEWIVV